MGGSTSDKYSIIDSWTYDRFVEARQNFQQVTTRNLQQWALAAAAQFSNFEFKASTPWVAKFKQKRRIRQRKVTKFVSRKETVTIEETLAAAESFRIQIRDLIPNFDEDFVINTDQTGCQYQSTYNRTLTDKGSKTVFVKRLDMNKVTHSYTAQYGITLSGRVLPRVFVCLQEVTNKFGPRIQKMIDEYAKKFESRLIAERLRAPIFNRYDLDRSGDVLGISSLRDNRHCIH
ncbi:uncharacterized protein LOC115239390 [Formica exsecta]|uniref:uncharacterized protein LOC115239390 n=1 Tax=Formica exsecta TaxID=72781 RepID=UPI001144037B|nr:uncharacterized protein LOC115239390 [Formica exsecta]